MGGSAESGGTPKHPMTEKEYKKWAQVPVYQIKVKTTGGHSYVLCWVSDKSSDAGIELHGSCGCRSWQDITPGYDRNGGTTWKRCKRHYNVTVQQVREAMVGGGTCVDCARRAWQKTG